MRLIFSLPIVLLLVSLQNGFSQDKFTNHLNANYSNDIAVEADWIWVATDVGIVKWDKAAWKYQLISVPDGLAHPQVYTVYIDPSGNKWFGTRGGVTEFDGSTWTTYTTTDGLSGNIVYSIARDTNGNLWFGSYPGVSKFNGTTWTAYTNANTSGGLVNDMVKAVAIDSAGNVWCGTGGYGISKFDGTNWTTYTTTEGLVGDNVKSVSVDTAGNVWIGTTVGVSKYDGSWTSYTNSNTSGGLINNSTNSILQDVNGNIWFGTLGGVSVFDGTIWTASYTMANTANRLGSDKINGIAFDLNGDRYFAAYTGGMSKYDGTTWSNFVTNDQIISNYIYTITFDLDGNAWLGTDGYGVSEFDGTNWTNYTYANTSGQLVDDYVYGVGVDRDGNKWFGTCGSGVSKFDGTTWTTYTNSSTSGGLASDWIYDVLVDRDGTIWFASNDAGVSTYDGTNWTTYNTTTTSGGLVNDDIYRMKLDPWGNVWFAHYGYGVSKFDPSTSSWTNYTNASTGGGLVNDSVCDVTVDRTGRLWVGTEGGGLSMFNGTTWTTYTNANTGSGLINDDIYALAADYFGNLWVGTDKGLCIYDGTNWTSYTTGDGLAGNSIQYINFDPQGNIWIATYSGASVVKGHIQVTVPNHISALTGDIIYVPVHVSGITPADSAISFEMKMVYDNSVINFHSIDKTGYQAASFTLETNTAVGTGPLDTLKIAGASSTPTDSGIFLDVKFQVDAGSVKGDVSVFQIVEFRFNEGLPPAGLGDAGSVTNEEYHKYGDITEDGSITSFDAAQILQFVVGIITLDAVHQAIADVSGNSLVNSFDASLILQYTAGFITTFPAGLTFTTKSALPPVPQGIIALKESEKTHSGFTYNLYVENGAHIFSGQWELQYDRTMATFEGAELIDWKEDYILYSNDDDATLKIAFAGSTPIDGDGILIKLHFSGEPGEKNGLRVVKASLNEQEIVMTTAGIPSNFNLEQNYPNPFNPITTINYQVPEQTIVELSIYNILGQKVRTLVNENKSPGYYDITWNGRDDSGVPVASGIYFYRLKTESYIKTRRMVLIR